MVSANVITMQVKTAKVLNDEYLDTSDNVVKTQTDGNIMNYIGLLCVVLFF